MYDSITDLPDNIQADCTPEEQAEYLRVYNTVFSQTKAADKATAAAWGCVKKMRMVGVSVMRSARNGEPIIGGWAMRFSKGGEDKDLLDTFFSRASRLMLEYYQGAPLWMEHGLDNDFMDDPIGKRYNSEVYGYGVWLDHTLHRNHPRYEETKTGIENGDFAYSSDSIGHYVERGFNPVNGRMDSWPFAGCSITREPAEPALGLVSFHTFLGALKNATGTPNLQNDSEEREAQRTGKRNFNFVSVNKQGEITMTAEMLAQLAEFLGCEATPEAVSVALQDLLTQLQAAPTEPTEVAAQSELVTTLAPALGLPAKAVKADVVAKVEAIKGILADMPDPKKGRKLNVGALRSFTDSANALLEDTPEDDFIPFYTGPDDDEDEDDEDDRRNPRARRSTNGRQVNFNHSRKSKKPGLMDVIGAISQVQAGPIQFEMPAFKSMRTSPAAALRSMNIVNAQSGGWRLNREISNQLLEALYADLVLEQLGAKMVPMDGIESITMNRVQSGAVAYWAGTDQTVSQGNAKIRAAVTLNTKELVAKAIIENKLLKNSGGGMVESMVEEDIRKVMKRKMELAAFYGSGSVPVDAGHSGAEPLGLKNITGINNTDLASASPTIDSLIAAEGAIEDANFEYTDLKWLSSKRARRFFKKMKDTKGHPLFSEDWITNDIRELVVQDHAFMTTTQVPNTTVSTVTTTDIFLGAWDSFLIGQGLDLEMVVDTSRYVEERSTLIQIVSYVDFGVEYKEAFHILKNAKV